MAWHEWLQPGPRRIASTRLICFSSGTAADILALPLRSQHRPLSACAGPTLLRPANTRAAAPWALPTRQSLTRIGAEPIAALQCLVERRKGRVQRQKPHAPHPAPNSRAPRAAAPPMTLENHNVQDATRQPCSTSGASGVRPAGCPTTTLPPAGPSRMPCPRASLGAREPLAFPKRTHLSPATRGHNPCLHARPPHRPGRPSPIKHSSPPRSALGWG